MGADDGVDRKRFVARPVLSSGPLAELKDALYGLYLSAGTPSVQRIHDRIRELADGDEAGDPTATPSKSVVHEVLSASTLPRNVHHVIAVAAALLHPHPAQGITPVVRGNPRIDRIRELWERAALHTPSGRNITDIPASDLEVRWPLPAGDRDAGPLPTYIPRLHDRVLRELVAAALADVAPRSGIAVLVSDSTSGKTRALFEVLYHPVLGECELRGRRRPRSLADAGWWVWPPRNPLPADRFLRELADVGPRAVVWLNEAQRYLLDPDESTARAIAAGMRALLADPARTPVLILGTLWPEYLDRITRSPGLGPDPHADARALIIDHTLPVPSVFTGADLDTARASGDTRVRDALATADIAHAQAGGIGRATRVALTQHMAGVPALLDLYDNAPTAVAAVLHAAMDARRLGHREWLPVALLHHAAPAYLDPHDHRRHLTDPDWFIRALNTLTAPRAAAARALHHPPAVPGYPTDVLRLEDYLDQYARTHRAELIPPNGFWNAAADHAHPGDLPVLGNAAQARGLLRHAAQLLKNAATHGNSYAAHDLLLVLNRLDPIDRRPANWAMEIADRSHDPAGLGSLLRVMSGQVDSGRVAELGTRAAAHATLVDPDGVAWLLSGLPLLAHRAVADLVARKPATQVALDNFYGVGNLLRALHHVGARDQVDELAARAISHTAPEWFHIVTFLLRVLHGLKVDHQVDELAAKAAAHMPVSNTGGVAWLLAGLRDVGADDRIGELAARAVAHVAFDDPSGVARLLERLYAVNAGEQAAELAAQAAAHVALDNPGGVAKLLEMLYKAGAHERVAELVARRPSAHAALDDPGGVARLLRILHVLGVVDQVHELAVGAITRIRWDNAGSVASLLDALHIAGADDQAAVLAEGAVSRVRLDNPGGVASLLDTLQQAGAMEQVAALVARTPALHVNLDDLNGITSLLDTLHTAEANAQFADLAARAAAHTTLRSHSNVSKLLGALRAAAEPTSMLISRLPASGRFDVFVTLGDHSARFRFGREPDGTATAPWKWTDLR